LASVLWPSSALETLVEIPQQPLDVVELELRAEILAEAAAQLFEDARARCTSISPGTLTVVSSP
jgi:hypothetical protein